MKNVLRNGGEKKHTAGLHRETAACLAILWQTTWEWASIFLDRAGENNIGSFQVYKICIRFHLRDNFGLIFPISQASHLFLKKNQIKLLGRAQANPIF